MRKAWTDDRMDDLVTRVDSGFAAVDKQFEQVDKRFEQVDKQFERIDERFLRVEEKIERSREETKEFFEALRASSDFQFQALNRRIDRYSLALVSSVLGILVAVLAS